MMKVVIIGNGIAGTTVATELRKKSKDIDITIISSESQYHYSRPSLMYLYMKTLTLKYAQPYENKYWKQNNINLVHDCVTSINYETKEIILKKNHNISYDKLVLAVGAKGKKFGWPGENLPQVLTFTNLQDLEQLELFTSKIKDISYQSVVVGGGLIGTEVVEMLRSRNIPVKFLVREKFFMHRFFREEESLMLQEEICKHGADLLLETELESVLSNDENNVTSIVTNKDEVIPCNLVVLAVGVSANLDLAHNSTLKINKGILVNKKMETNIPDVYAAGDCVEFSPEGTLELMWYTAKMHGKVLVDNILGSASEYNRGILYNSAKFFTIDYHTYGQVGFNISGEQELYYRVPNQNKSIRIVYLPDRVIGFNILGIRFRHKVCEEWIRDKKSLDFVLDHLQEANFDPEFFQQFHKEVKLCKIKAS